MKASHKQHIQLLTDAEIESLYARPLFNLAERKGYFYLEALDRALLESVGNVKSQLYFILQLGYFRAKQLFYHFTFEDVESDWHYIAEQYFATQTFALTGQVAKSIKLQQQRLVLQRYGYKRWSTAFKSKTLKQLHYLVRLHPKGHDTFQELLVYFEQAKITIPTYRTCQDLITHALSDERERLANIFKGLSANDKATLDLVIKNDNNGNLLTTLRHDQKDFRYFAIKSEMNKASTIQSLYTLGKTLLPKLELADNTIAYYAQLIDHYFAARTRKLSIYLQHLYIVCFVHHRYQIIMDNLIMSFMLHLRNFLDDGTAYAKQKEADYIAGITLEFPKLAKLLNWFCDNNVAPQTPYTEFCKSAFDILPKEKQRELANYISGLRFDVEAAKWEFYEKSARRIAMYLRPIMLHVAFAHAEPDNTVSPLLDAIKTHFQSKRSANQLAKKIPDALLTTMVPSVYL